MNRRLYPLDLSGRYVARHRLTRRLYVARELFRGPRVWYVRLRIQGSINCRITGHGRLPLVWRFRIRHLRLWIECPIDDIGLAALSLHGR